MANKISGKAAVALKPEGLPTTPLGCLEPTKASEVNVLEVATLAWEKGLSASAIVRKLGLEGGTSNSTNVMKVKRALKRAVNEGILTIQPPPEKDLERQLNEKLLGKGVQVETLCVAHDHTAACLYAARMVEEEIAEFLVKADGKEQFVVANAGGGTVAKVCEYVQRLYFQRSVELPSARESGKRLVFLSLNAAEARQKFNECANFLAVRFAEIYACEHLAVVSDDDSDRSAEEMKKYMAAVDAIDLLITSAGSIPETGNTRMGFLAGWLHARKQSCPEEGVGDIAFSFVNSEGYSVLPDAAANMLIKQHIRPQPAWTTLDKWMRTGKVLLVLTGDKAVLGDALISGAHATRSVVDAQVAHGMLERLDARYVG